MADEGFVKAQSDNLPAVDFYMVVDFLQKSKFNVGAEMRGVKAARSARENYGDNAVDYVQLKREGNICFIKCRVTPEHKIRKKGYSVFCKIDEELSAIVSASCEDCIAATGGCKHVIAFLFWLHRRSEEPARTDVECYWKRSKLACVGSSIKFLCVEDMGALPHSNSDAKEQQFFRLFMEKANNQSIQLVQSLTVHQTISIHHLLVNFKASGGERNPDAFLNYCSGVMDAEECNSVWEQTKVQSNCKLWAEMRYGRVTASKLHEVAHCKTGNGSTVDSLLGATKMIKTVAMARGLSLEPLVIKCVEKEYGIRVNKSGLFLNSEFPVMGASPDGITEHFVIEIKCPASHKSIDRYTENGHGQFPSRKYLAQVQLQMLMSGKKKALFCVADSDFELTSNINIIEIDFNKAFCYNIMKEALQFWKVNVFPLIYNSL